ncbi:Nucleolar essential protein 1 [Nosema bombycis CQ1]|uniref:Nucleolar essential protein 1 n=1 Tax=Nosema bombycis (strain CQ1 / CVCC 102059) TaxID=578461 RepID=R0MNI9_NOSB1|nr:Nucleolar essential protein 1 [Nosema bombycis CQ1]|eukprot:EOB14413.1 Nucleolar essential protein 1 [Nosema bombycis CQ1]
MTFLTVILKNSEILKKNDAFYKTHRSLKILLTSPLAKTSYLRVILHTSSNVMIELNSKLDIPSDIDEYSEMMEYLSKRMKLKTSDNKILAKVVKSKIEEHLDPNTYKIGLSPEGKQLTIDNSENVSYSVFINVDKEKEMNYEVEYNIRVSDYELGIDHSLFRLVNLFEKAYEIF